MSILEELKVMVDDFFGCDAAINRYTADIEDVTFDLDDFTRVEIYPYADTLFLVSVEAGPVTLKCECENIDNLIGLITTMHACMETIATASMAPSQTETE